MAGPMISFYYSFIYHRPYQPALIFPDRIEHRLIVRHQKPYVIQEYPLEFSEISHPDNRSVTSEQYENRMILRNAMIRGGFEPLSCEWWHFTLKDEPYPDTYFEFPVSSAYLKR